MERVHRLQPFLELIYLYFPPSSHQSFSPACEEGNIQERISDKDLAFGWVVQQIGCSQTEHESYPSVGRNFTLSALR